MLSKEAFIAALLARTIAVSAREALLAHSAQGTRVVPPAMGDGEGPVRVGVAGVCAARERAVYVADGIFDQTKGRDCPA